MDPDKKKDHAHRSDHEECSLSKGGETECARQEESVCNKRKNDMEDPILRHRLVLSYTPGAKIHEHRVDYSRDAEYHEKDCRAGERWPRRAHDRGKCRDRAEVS